MREGVTVIITTKSHDFEDSIMYIISEGEVHMSVLKAYDIVFHKFWENGRYGVDFKLAKIINERYGINIPTSEEELHQYEDGELKAHMCYWFIPKEYKVSKLIIDTKEYSLDTMRELNSVDKIDYVESIIQCLDNVSTLGNYVEEIAEELDVDLDVIRAIYERALISHGEMGYYEAVKEIFMSPSEALEEKAQIHWEKYQIKK